MTTTFIPRSLAWTSCWGQVMKQNLLPPALVTFQPHEMRYFVWRKSGWSTPWGPMVYSAAR